MMVNGRQVGKRNITKLGAMRSEATRIGPGYKVEFGV